MNTLTIFFDGGCFPNPGQKYGSFQVLLGSTEILKRIRVMFNRGTNNEAEFNALQMALQETDNWLAERKIDPKTLNLVIETDSKIVWYRLTKKNKVHGKPAWKSASERMFALAEEVLKFKPRFNSFTVNWKPREHNVQRFGH